MTFTSYNDISFVLSGGSTNINPNASIGGEPSSSPIVDNMINNLYDDVSSDQSRDGMIDYRCFYVFNDGPTPIYNIRVWVVSQSETGANVELGVESRDELQRVTIDSVAVESGTFTMSYGGHSFVVTKTVPGYDPLLALQEWVNSFRSGLLNLRDEGKQLLYEVQVFGQYASGNTIFDINFLGRDGKREHPQLMLESNNLVPSANIEITTLQNGFPINTIASEIGVESNPPGGITFYTPNETYPITVPYMKQEDGFPIWVKRTVFQNTEAVEQDGFVLRFSAESLDPGIIL